MAWPVGFTRAVLFFVAPESDGYSEEYVARDADVPDPPSWAAGLVEARLKLLPETYTLNWARVNHPHDARTLLPYFGPPSIPAVGTYAASTDFQRCEVGALVKFYTASGRYSTRIFRGVASAAVASDGRLLDGSAWKDELTLFCDYLLSTATVGLINTRPIVSAPAYTFELYTQYQILHTSTRDVGRPFGLRRGRSAA